MSRPESHTEVPAYCLGIDIGTSGAKVVLIDEQGVAVGSRGAEYPLLTPRPLWAEQYPQDWWDGAIAATRALLAEFGIAGPDVRGVGLSGQVHGSVFLDAAGDVLRPAILWCDQRTHSQCGVRGHKHVIVRVVVRDGYLRPMRAARPA